MWDKASAVDFRTPVFDGDVVEVEMVVMREVDSDFAVVELEGGLDF